MIKTFRTIFISIVLETILTFRIKEGIFFGIIMPVFLFVLFGYIWGGANPGYVHFLLSGIIGMSILSDGMYGIGPVMKIYQERHILKYIRNLPINILVYFIGFFFSKIIIMCLVIFLISVSSILFFNLYPTGNEIFLFFIGAILGTLLFGFLSLIISFTTKADASRGLNSFLFFVMMFICGTFFPIDNFPGFLKLISKILPLTHLLNFMRGDLFYLNIVILWILVFASTFYLVFTKSSIKR